MPRPKELRPKNPKTSKIRKRIEDSLRISSKPKNKEFWYGFLVGLVDHKVISKEEYRNLRDMVDGWR